MRYWSFTVRKVCSLNHRVKSGNIFISNLSVIGYVSLYTFTVLFSTKHLANGEVQYLQFEPHGAKLLVIGMSCTFIAIQFKKVCWALLTSYFCLFLNEVCNYYYDIYSTLHSFDESLMYYRISEPLQVTDTLFRYTSKCINIGESDPSDSTYKEVPRHGPCWLTNLNIMWHHYHWYAYLPLGYKTNRFTLRR